MSQSRGPGGSTDRLRELMAGRGPLIAAGGVVLIVVIAIAVLVLGGGSTSSPSANLPVNDSGGLAAGSPLPTPQATIDLNRPNVSPTIDPNAPRPGAPGDKITIAKIGVDAVLTYKAVGLDGVMPNPDGPDDIAVYDFTQYWPGLGGIPGFGGNTVFAGHVDWGSQHGIGCKNNTKPPPCFAVLWDLGKLAVGDEIKVSTAGKTYSYNVTSNQPVSATSGDWTQIVTSTGQETLTIITCGGDFNPVTHEYNTRQVVTATRGNTG
jgi:hypothetical protein